MVVVERIHDPAPSPNNPILVRFRFARICNPTSFPDQTRKPVTISWFPNIGESHAITIVDHRSSSLRWCIAGAVPLAQGAKPYGAASPQEAVAALKKASAANDMLPALPVISPSGLKLIANEGVTGLLMVLAFSDPDDAMPGSTKPSKTELDAKRKQYQQAVDLAAQTLKPYGLDALIGKPVMAPEMQKSLDAALDKADNVVLITSLYGAMAKIGPLLGMKESPKPTRWSRSAP